MKLHFFDTEAMLAEVQAVLPNGLAVPSHTLIVQTDRPDEAYDATGVVGFIAKQPGTSIDYGVVLTPDGACHQFSTEDHGAQDYGDGFDLKARASELWQAAEDALN